MLGLFGSSPPGLPVVQERKRSTWSDPSPPEFTRGAGEVVHQTCRLDVRLLPPRACPWRRRGSVLCSAPPPPGLPVAQERERVIMFGSSPPGLAHGAGEEACYLT